MISVDEAKKLVVVLEMPVAYILTIEEEDRRESAGPDAITQEFTYVYNACSDKGKEYLERAIGGAKRVFMEERRQKNKLR